VDGAAGAVTPQHREVQCFGDHTLACERGIAVQHQRQHGERAVALVVQVLLGPHQAFEDRVDGLEVRRVGGEGDVDLVVAEHLVVLALGAEVVLDVARAVRLRRVQIALELGEDLRVGLADDVREHVEAAAVGHAHNHFVEAVFGALIDHAVHHRDDCFGTLEREPFLADVLGLQEGLECLGGVELGEDVLLLCDRWFDVLDLHPFLQPLLLLGLEDVCVLHTDVPAVGVSQDRQDVAQFHLVLAVETTDVEAAIEVPERQIVGQHIEVGVSRPCVRIDHQWVDVGHQMAPVAICRNQFEHAGVLVDGALGDVATPADRLVRDVQRGEDLVEELIRQQQMMDGAQEVTRLRALDDAVVIG